MLSQHVKFWKIPWKTVNIHTSLYTENKFWTGETLMGKKTPEFYKNGFTVKRIHKNSLGSVYEMQLQSLTCSDLSPIKVCSFFLLQRISHTPSVMLLLLSKQRFPLALGWLCYSPSVLFELCSVISRWSLSISVDLPWFDLISAFYSHAGSYSVA